MSKTYSAPFRTHQAVGVSSGTSHLLPQRWHISISGRLGLPQLAQVTSVIFGWVNLYVIYPVRPKETVANIQKSLAFLGSPTLLALTLTYWASNSDNIIDGNINSMAVMNLSAIFPLTSRPFIATNELGRMKSAL